MDVVDDEVVASSLAIVLDTSNAARIDDDRYQLAKKSIRIDHHVQVETICDEEWIDDKASATCELLALYLQEKKGQHSSTKFSDVISWINSGQYSFYDK